MTTPPTMRAGHTPWAGEPRVGLPARRPGTGAAGSEAVPAAERVRPSADALSSWVMPTTTEALTLSSMVVEHFRYDRRGRLPSKKGRLSTARSAMAVRVLQWLNPRCEAHGIPSPGRLHCRLVLINVERGPADDTAAQRLHQRHLVHHRERRGSSRRCPSSSPLALADCGGPPRAGHGRRIRPLEHLIHADSGVEKLSRPVVSTKTSE